ncbi:hypothetical protein FXF51_32100 [Nonomuraea sp. PA05]|uniref:hypothetical protein n=1 Tax=Nonomuraea sp. PA05 TaxID=2604466 RepID=UPI0011D631B2|nr:hypothetical protein [Nonomuraea sp. PA05]TYB60237.1 hypothetical protein FXF51_32100 [Nonomuraea sp. PA05]
MASIPLTAGLLPPTPASADALDVTCTPPSSVAVTYSPPLTASPQTVTSTTNQQYGPCVSAGVPGLTSGSRYTVVTSSGLSCLELLAARPFAFTITWNTGQTSTISGNLVANLAAGVLTGTVTSGLFAGDTVVQQQVGAAPSRGLEAASHPFVGGIGETVGRPYAADTPGSDALAPRTACEVRAGAGHMA